MDDKAAPWRRASTRSNRHSVIGGPSLEVGPDGTRFYTVTCACGWHSEECSSSVLADAAGEQHVTLSASRQSRATNAADDSRPGGSTGTGRP